MKKLILKFLRPYVILILKDALKVAKNKTGVVSVTVVTDPPTGEPPIIP